MGGYTHLLYFSIFVILWTFCTSAASEEQPTPEELAGKTKHYKDGKHNEEFDQEAFLGEEVKTFGNLSPEERKKRLGIIADKIDNTKDGLISHEELKDWIRYTQEKFVRDNVERTWKSHNPSGKERISWEEYSELVYGFMKDMPPAELEKKNSGLTYQGFYDRDHRRWVAADINGDGMLTKFEFFSFLHPEESQSMHDLVVLETLEDMDKDKDGKISLEEYVSDMYQGEEDSEKPQWIENEIDNFKKHRDKDGDGFLTGDEVKSITIPEDFDHADAEARHLIYEADQNGDQHLTKEEILDKYDVFVGSQATDFGEALLRHDEF